MMHIYDQTISEKQSATPLLERYLQTKVVKNTPTQRGRKLSSSLMTLVPLAAASLLSTSVQAQCGQGTASFSATGGAFGDGLVDVDGDGNPDFQFDIYNVGTASRPVLFVTVVGTVGIGLNSTGAPLAFGGGSLSSGNFGGLATAGYLGLFYMDGGTPFTAYVPIQDAAGAIGFLELTFDGAGGYTVGTAATGLSEDDTPGNIITLGDCSSLESALPVELTALTAETLDKQIQLTWQTLSESSNEGFAIERSTDGEQWANVGWVSGNGSTADAHNYTFNDDQLLSNIAYYYRLKQMDFDGSFNYSEVVNGMITDLNKAGVSEIFPNPVSAGFAQLQIQALQADRAQVSIINAAGQQITQQQYNLISGSNTIELPTTSLVAGSYFVKVELQEQIIYKKLSVTD